MRYSLLRHLLVGFVVLGGLAVGGPRAAEPPSWPRFHGPTGDNISPDTGLLAKWPKEGPKLLWTAKDLGEGFSSVALAGGRIYTNGNKDDKTTITALDLDGKVLWQRPNGAAWSGGRPGTRSTPTIDGDRLYDESPLGEVACLETKDGKPLWHVNILEKFAADEHQVGPGRVALDRRPARDLLPRRAADRRGRAGQEDGRGGLEIALDGRRDRLRFARGDPVRRPANRADHDRQGPHRRGRRLRWPCCSAIRTKPVSTSMP